MAQAAVIKSVREYLKSLNANGFNVSFGILFGSQAAGNATELSDIDIVVISPDFDGKLQCSTMDLIWQLAAKTDTRIEPIPCGLERWKKDNYTPIIDIARNEGTVISLN